MARPGRRSPKPVAPEDVELVETDDGLRALCDAAAAAGRFGIDTEFVRDRTYYSRLALVQIAVDDRFALIDVVAGVDLAPLDALIGDPSVVKVLHAATQDLEIFWDRTGAPAANVFDTQVAGAMVGFGYQVGYVGLVRDVLGVQLGKGQQYTDWLRRPLSAQQLKYAADDVRYLLPMMDALLERVDALGRRAALDEELLPLCDPKKFELSLKQLVSKVKGAGALKGKNRGALFELVEWREEEARRRDAPRRWVLPDPALAAIARALPRSMRELGRIRGLDRRDLDRDGKTILEVVEAGTKRRPPEPTHKRPSVHDGPSGRAAVPLVRALLESLCLDQGLAMPIVATTATVEALAISHAAGTLEEDGNPLLDGWRGELFGRPLLDFLDGRVALHRDPKTGVLLLSERQ